MTLFVNLIIGTLVYGGMAALYTLIALVPVAAVLGAVRLRTAMQHTTHRPTIHRRPRHGYQTH